VWGPPGTFIEDNNELALALIMTVPLMRYLQLQFRNKWVRLAFYPAMMACVLSALGSHSRGALLAMAAMAFMLWLRGSRKLMTAPVFVLAGIALIALMPEHWGDRMETIATYEQDASAMGRINAWWAAFNIAQDRMLGGGFDLYRPDVFAIYAPVPDDVHAAHSIYFQVLGELGFIGLAIFLSFWFFTWRTAAWVRRHARNDPETEWASTLAGLCQVSLVAYFIGGAFLSLSYFDLPYNLMVLVVVARQIVEKRLKGTKSQPTTMVAIPQAASPPPANRA
jgi:putative inorganic carbon (HCO3(-)) transporter